MYLSKENSFEFHSLPSTFWKLRVRWEVREEAAKGEEWRKNSEGRRNRDGGGRRGRGRREKERETKGDISGIRAV